MTRLSIIAGRAVAAHLRVLAASVGALAIFASSAQAAGLARYADDFDRSSLGADWIVDNLSFAISNDQLVETAPQTFAPAQMRYRGGGEGGDAGTTDQFAKVQIVGSLTSTPVGLILRANDPGQSLAAHYEIHFKMSNGQWRWEYYDPGFVATLSSCPSGESLGSSDWIGARVTGSGSATELAVYRWDDDPDGGGEVDVATNWGPADCTLTSASGPFASGAFGGVRFYGSDPAQSRADNWSFGSAQSSVIARDPIRGGLLWDRWFDVNGAPEPVGEHPLYPLAGQQAGRDTYRCVECHGWDYAGVDGEYGSGPHFTGIAGVFGSTATPSEMFDLIESGSGPDGHDFGSYGLGDTDIWDLVEFLQQEVVDTAPFIDGAGQFLGDALDGAANYAADCASCHGADGSAINFGTAQDPRWVGTVAVESPWQFFHKVRFGHPGSAMPSWLALGGDDAGAGDIGAYAQSSLPIECLSDTDCDDALFCSGVETCNAGVCETGVPSCVDAAHCDEGADICLECIADAECDDGAFCSGVEICSAGFCADGAASCIDLAHCDESADICLECIADAECADGAFCNGEEICGAGFCGPGYAPCTDVSLCSEPADVCTAIATDPFVGSLWALDNQGQTGGAPGADIDIANAWTFGVGSPDVVVAVLDSGVDYTHPDLAANIWTNTGEIPSNGIDDDANGYVDDTIGWDFINGDNDPFDDGGHGTHVAGIIGAVGNNGVGVVGVNHTVSIMPLKIQSSSQVGTLSAAIEAIEYAVANGAHVMSNSWAASSAWGEPGWNQPGFSPALQAAIEAANAAGVLFVATAGNSAESKDVVPIYPASYPNDNIIAVAATDENDVLASWSSFGATSIDLAAPGVGILSTVPSSCFIFSPPPGGGSCDGSGYLSASGTSTSTPYVAGVAALVLARFPGIALPELKDRLLFGTDPLPSLAGVTVSGGRLNAAKAIEDDTFPPSAINDASVVDSTEATIEIGFTASGDDASTGLARVYDIRYSTAPIDDSNFESAIPLLNAPLPSSPGTPETVELLRDESDAIYHIRVKPIDNAGNRAAISNTLIVPEPGGLALLICGVALLVALARARASR